MSRRAKFMLPALLLVAAHLMLVVEATARTSHYNQNRFKAIVFNDRSNDQAIDMNAQQLLQRSGFGFEVHHSIADDGYVTQLIRIINPRADRSLLKSPPVMLFHGAGFDQTAFLVASSIQHHPEKYPRTYEADGPITSSNRSLGFVLANNGYDVWLVGTRGSNEGNQGFVKDVRKARASYGHFKLTSEHYTFIKRTRSKYFLYGQDEIIAHELREQFDRVLHLTGAGELSVLAHSMSAPTTMAFLGANPEYAKIVRVYLQMAPTIAADHIFKWTRTQFEVLDPHRHVQGEGYLGLLKGQILARRRVLGLSKVPAIRYQHVYTELQNYYGPSPKYQTHLELNLIAHIYADVSHKMTQQYSQNSVSKKLAKFDYGKRKNVAMYGQPTPPAYDIRGLEVQKYIVLDGSYDALADQTTTLRLVNETRTHLPITHLTAHGYNHLDLIGGVENDRYVNLPILAQLNSFSCLLVARTQ